MSLIKRLRGHVVGNGSSRLTPAARWIVVFAAVRGVQWKVIIQKEEGGKKAMEWVGFQGCNVWPEVINSAAILWHVWSQKNGIRVGHRAAQSKVIVFLLSAAKKLLLIQNEQHKDTYRSCREVEWTNHEELTRCELAFDLVVPPDTKGNCPRYAEYVCIIYPWF